METYIVLILALERIFMFLTGLAITVLGYLLFSRGVFGGAGDVEAMWSNNKILMKRCAPGTFFVIAGVLVIGIGMLRPLEYHGDNNHGVACGVPDYDEPKADWEPAKKPSPKIDPPSIPRGDINPRNDGPA